MRWGVVAVAMLVACFNKPVRPSSAVTYVGTFDAHDITQAAPIMFMQAAAAEGDAIVVHVASNAAGTAIEVLAPGWSFVPLGTNQNAASFGAIAPDSKPAMFTVTSSPPGSGIIVLADEFSGNDPAGGLGTFDAHNEGAGNGDCTVSVVPRHNDDAVWAACTCLNGNVDVGSGFSPGAATNGNVAEYTLAATAGTSEQLVMPVIAGANPSYVITAVTIKPR
jgi:hypothetical protein